MIVRRDDLGDVFRSGKGSGDDRRGVVVIIIVLMESSRISVSWIVCSACVHDEASDDGAGREFVGESTAMEWKIYALDQGLHRPVNSYVVVLYCVK